MKAKKIAGQQPTEGSSKKIPQSAVARLFGARFIHCLAAMARCSERTVHIQGAMHPYLLKWLENHRRLNARSSLRVSLHLLHFTCSVPEHPSIFLYSLLPQTGQNLQPMLNCACCILFSGLFLKERLFDWIIFILQNGWCPMGGSGWVCLLWPASAVIWSW